MAICVHRFFLLFLSQDLVVGALIWFFRSTFGALSEHFQFYFFLTARIVFGSFQFFVKFGKPPGVTRSYFTRSQRCFVCVWRRFLSSRLLFRFGWGRGFANAQKQPSRLPSYRFNDPKLKSESLGLQRTMKKSQKKATRKPNESGKNDQVQLD